MSTEADSERPEVMLGTTSTAPVPPAALEPENTVGGPRIQLYTSLSGGSSYVITAQARIETLLKAQKISYDIIDLATDEKAKKVWRWHSKGRKLPGVVRVDVTGETIVGGLDELEQANEYGELKQLVLEGGD